MTTKTTTKKSKGPRCECGGQLSPVILGEVDFSPYSGIASKLEGAPGWRCDKCGNEVLHGKVINHALNILALEIVSTQQRLPADLAKYLRRRLQVTQQELAVRMGIVRETVASWECGASDISAQHDLILRMLAIGACIGPEALQEILTEARELMQGLSSVRTAPPPSSKKRKPLRVEKNRFESVQLSA